MASQLKTLAALNLDAAGTAQQVSSTVLEVEVAVITAASGNSGTIYIGDSNVASNRYAGALAAGERMTIVPGDVGGGGTDFVDLSEIYFDGGTTGDDIQVGYIQKAN